MSIDSSRDLLIALSLLPFLTPNRTRLLLEFFDPLEQVRHASTTLLQGLLSVTPEQADSVNKAKARTGRVVADVCRDGQR
jgi:hypothetical protein